MVGDALSSFVDYWHFADEPIFHFTCPYWTWGDPQAASLAHDISPEDKRRLFEVGQPIDTCGISSHVRACRSAICRPVGPWVDVFLRERERARARARRGFRVSGFGFRKDGSGVHACESKSKTRVSGVGFHSVRGAEREQYPLNGEPDEPGAGRGLARGLPPRPAAQPHERRPADDQHVPTHHAALSAPESPPCVALVPSFCLCLCVGEVRGRGV